MFLTVMTVAEALTRARARAAQRDRRGARRRSASCPREDVTSGERLPGWARATVDGYAVRAADTYAASETLPTFLELAGAVTHGRASPTARSVRARR